MKKNKEKKNEKKEKKVKPVIFWIIEDVRPAFPPSNRRRTVHTEIVDSVTPIQLVAIHRATTERRFDQIERSQTLREHQNFITYNFSIGDDFQHNNKFSTQLYVGFVFRCQEFIIPFAESRLTFWIHLFLLYNVALHEIFTILYSTTPGRPSGTGRWPGWFNIFFFFFFLFRLFLIAGVVIFTAVEFLSSFSSFARILFFTVCVFVPRFLTYLIQNKRNNQLRTTKIKSCIFFDSGSLKISS